jgi:aquaporin-4
VGTYLLVLIGPGTVISVATLPNLSSAFAISIVALVFGGTVGAIILLFGKYSAQINPAVTVAHVFAKLTLPRRLIPYLCFQVFGGLLAGLTLRAAFGSFGSGSSFGSTKLSSGVNPTLGILLEVVGTATLSLSALIATRFVQSDREQAILVGGTLFILILLIGPLTGASFNPSRSFGPSLVSGFFVNQYVYWVGPLLGGLVAALLFTAFRYQGAGNDRKELPVCLC